MVCFLNILFYSIFRTWGYAFLKRKSALCLPRRPPREYPPRPVRTGLSLRLRNPAVRRLMIVARTGDGESCVTNERLVLRGENVDIRRITSSPVVESRLPVGVVRKHDPGVGHEPRAQMPTRCSGRRKCSLGCASYAFPNDGFQHFGRRFMRLPSEPAKRERQSHVSRPCRTA
jgi:hypothetical protein